jgi:SulP family sulfate permease
MNNLKKYITILDWLPGYNKQKLSGDLSAGLTVGVMLIPQGMAYAMIAGLPPIYGLYSSLIPLVVYAIFGTSRQLAVGPVAMVSLLIAAGIGEMAEIGSEEFIGLAIVLALVVGIIQFMLGALRLGFIVNFLSHPVISGFTSAAALIIGLNQLKHLLGVDIARSNYVHEILIQAGQSMADVNPITFLIGISAIAIIIGIKKLKIKAIPGPLLAVVVGVLLVYLLNLDQNGVKIVGEVPSGLPAFTIPTVDVDLFSSLFGIALTISLVGFMESVAVAKAMQAKHKDYEVVANQELIGLGLANIFGSMFQAFPTTGGFSRTAVNDQAGAKTAMASIISAVLIALTLLFLTPLFYYLPKAILASVIMVAVFGLIDFKEPIKLWKSDRTDFFMLIATFLATLAFGIEEGILIGVVLSLTMVIYRSAYPHMASLGRIPGTTQYRNVERYAEAEERDDVLVVRVDAQMYFANTGYFKEKLDKWSLQKGDNLKLIIFSSQAINAIDSTAIHAISDIYDEYSKQGIKLYMAAVKGPVRDKLAKAGFVDKVGKENFFLHVQEAVEHFDKKKEGVKKEFVLQTNV